MKQRVTILCLAFFAAVLISACQSGGTNSQAGEATANASAPAKTATAKVDQKASLDEIRAVLAQHDKALGEKNIDGVLATFSNDANAVVLGTGSEEKWMGQQEIKAAYTEMFKDYDPGTLESKCDWKTGGANNEGDMAWLAAICAAKDSKDGKIREYTLNVSAGLAKQDGKWRFVVLHMSNAFTPPVTK